jgi:cytochrome c
MEAIGRTQRLADEPLRAHDRTGKLRRMDSMEVNKGIAAVLVGGIIFFITGMLGDILVRQTPLEKPVLAIAAAPTAAAGAPAAPAGPGDITGLLASANVQDGEQFTHRVCIACHTFDKGGKNGVGPNLYGVVGGPHDHEASFNYSPAMEKFKGQPWTFDALNHWLYKPSAYAPGTRMSFAGISSDKQRADVIAYLRTLSDNPVPLPKPEEAQKPAAATPAAASSGGGAGAQPAAPQATTKPAAPAPAANPPANPPAKP